jgi:hypothetical protein
METEKYCSAEIGLLVAALAKAQGTYKPLKANQDSPRGRYGNLEATLDAVRESLSLNGLSFHQYEYVMDEGLGAVILKTIIAHESNQFISSWARLIKGETLRETGTMTETIKRRQAQMLLGIAPSPYDPAGADDDGAEMAEKALMREVRKPREDQKSPDRNDVIDVRQYNELMLELEGYSVIAKDIMKKHQLESLADLPNSEYYQVLTNIRKVKKTQEEHERRPR